MKDPCLGSRRLVTVLEREYGRANFFLLGFNTELQRIGIGWIRA
jgi:hypothetical protein